MNESEEINIQLNDLYRWAKALDEKALAKVRDEQGEDAYKMLFTAAYLFSEFADRLGAGDFEELDGSLN